MNNNKYRLFDNLIEGVQVIDHNLKYYYLNDAIVNQAKTTKDDLLGEKITEKYPGIEQTEMFSLLQDCLKTKKANHLQNKFKFPDGSVGWFELSIQPVDEGALILSYEVTNLKLIENELKDKLAERSIMVNRIEEQKKQLEEFCNIIAHNLRSPLSNLLMLSDMIEQSKSVEEKIEFLEKINPVINFLNETFDELVDATQIRTDNQVKKDRIDIDECTNQILAGLQADIIKSDAKISSDFSDINTIYYPKKYFKSILFNLISNAIKYQSPHRKPEINIKSYKDNGRTFIEVKDNGIGIDLKKYGNKLFKLHKTFHDHPNSKGFGLFITKTQVESMGGSISAESIPGTGSTFTIKF